MIAEAQGLHLCCKMGLTLMLAASLAVVMAKLYKETKSLVSGDAQGGQGGFAFGPQCGRSQMILKAG